MQHRISKVLWSTDVTFLLFDNPVCPLSLKDASDGCLDDFLSMFQVTPSLPLQLASCPVVEFEVQRFYLNRPAILALSKIAYLVIKKVTNLRLALYRTHRNLARQFRNLARGVN